MIEKLLQKNPDAIAIYLEDKAISYRQLWLQVKELSFALKQKGVKESDRVLFIADTCLDSILSFLALLQLRASPCLLSARIPQERIADYIQYSRSSFFLDPATQTLQKTGSFSFEESFIFLFTSGSSGTPKLAALNLEHFEASAIGALDRFKLASTDSWLLSLPLFHVSGLSILFRCFLSTSAIILEKKPLESSCPATHLSLVPTQLLRLLNNQIFLHKAKFLLIGGAPISKQLMDLALQKELPIYLTYGMTEMASAITMTDSLTPSSLPHVGTALPGREYKLHSDGEILVRGSTLFAGYDSLEGLCLNLVEGGWFPTKDLGSVDAQGNLQIKGRKDNLFISGGENIYPEEIERALVSLPGVLEAIVVPMQDPEFGKRPVAFVEMNTPFLSKESFHEKLSPLLPKFCLPIHFLPFPEEERKKGAKIKRKDLASFLEQMTT
jgi:O-succinylbenzoic acid--CoA ligase